MHKVLKIVTIPDPVLTKITVPITVIGPDILKLADEMIATCRKANGIGLAAPQIGRSIRICIINLEHIGMAPFVLINPKIIKKSWKKIEMEEGCLSIPGVFGIVKRPEKIWAKAQNLSGEKLEFNANGLLSRVIQHEVDHLDGILFTTKVTRLTKGSPDEKM